MSAERQFECCAEVMGSDTDNEIFVFSAHSDFYFVNMQGRE